jgi:hypothetical protein
MSILLCIAISLIVAAYYVIKRNGSSSTAGDMGNPDQTQKNSNEGRAVAKPTRNLFLTMVLVVLTLIAAFIIFADVAASGRLFVLYPAWATYAMLTISPLRLAAIVGIWLWNKAAIVAFAVLTIVSTAIWLALGGSNACLPDFTFATLLILVLPIIWPKSSWGIKRLLPRPPSE